MGKLPVVSGAQLVRVLEKAGFQVLRQRGSHIVLQKREPDRIRTTVVPTHRELAKGTLSGILKQAQLTPDDLVRLLTVVLGITLVFKK
jgi:predicted RNA binding protein YcfA (HicA-like mRNA interferase family)